MRYFVSCQKWPFSIAGYRGYFWGYIYDFSTLKCRPRALSKCSSAALRVSRGCIKIDYSAQAKTDAL